jgi:hypothetical protein
MMRAGVWSHATVIVTRTFLVSIIILMIPIVTCIGPTAGEWTVQDGASYPISITTNVETAGNGTKSLRQTGTLMIETTSGTSADYTGCAGCSGQCLVLNRSALVPDWDMAWYTIYGNYNASDETNIEITCLCPGSNTIPAKVLTITNWQNVKTLLQAKSDALKLEAEAMGATDYVGTISGSDPTFELSYSYSNGTSDTGVKCNGKISYTSGVLAKLVFNIEWKGDTSALPPNTVVLQSEKWTMGDQDVGIPGYPFGALVVATLVGLALILRKKSC